MTGATLGRHRSSRMRAWLDDGMTACVIGSDRSTRDLLVTILSEHTALPPRALDLTPRALDVLARGWHCLVVVDAAAEDPIAYHNELARRLRGRGHRNVPIVLCCGDDHDLRPPLNQLAGLPNVTILRRPFDAQTFVDSVERALVSAGAARDRSA